MKCIRIETTQPADWLEAFKAEAKRRGLSLSAYVGERCKAGLPAEIRRKLSKRASRGAPEKA